MIRFFCVCWYGPKTKFIKKTYIGDMIEFTTTKRVLYSETDQMGYVYYGHYSYIYEIGRAELLRDIDYTYRQMEEEGIMCPVMTMQIRYVRPAKYDDLITIKTSLRKLPAKTVTFHCELFNEEGKLLNAGFIKLAFVDAKTGKGVHASEKLLAKLKPYFESTGS